MACRLFGPKTLSQPIMAFVSLTLRALRTGLGDIWIKIQPFSSFSFNNINGKMVYVKGWRPFCVDLSVLIFL